jgi:N-sulfoglucosamine sulfohydrolase
VKTPTFDRVARSGVVFTHAHVAAPSCSPSRAAILTGQWHWRLREGANLWSTLPAEFPVYPDLLEAQGYHVGHTRKGWGPGNAAAGGRSRNPAGPQFPDFDAFQAARSKDKPFCFWFGSQDPHRPYDWESGVRSGLRLEDVRVPPYLPDSEIVRKDICDYYLEVQRFDREVGELLSKIERAGELENTLVVMAGDNGWPFPRAKATVYNTGTNVPLAMWWPGVVEGGRTVQDFVSLSDMAPTFLEAAQITPPREMTARSLWNVLESRKSGWVDRARSHVLTGMERHVPSRGPEKAGYPMRSLHTRDFHYIRNFAPERWPAGDPNGIDDQNNPFTHEQLLKNTHACFADIDSGPTKAYLIENRREPGARKAYELATGKRPPQELYDTRSDPFEMRNLAGDARYAKVLKKLDAQLTTALEATGDPRIQGRGEELERYPYRG